jgi:hypothetical protein
VENECVKSCPFSTRIYVRFQQELLSALRRNCCPFSARIGVRFAQEYASRKFKENRDQRIGIKGGFSFKG